MMLQRDGKQENTEEKNNNSDDDDYKSIVRPAKESDPDIFVQK